jgi:hypothetical protein
LRTTGKLTNVAHIVFIPYKIVTPIFFFLGQFIGFAGSSGPSKPTFPISPVHLTSQRDATYDIRLFLLLLARRRWLFMLRFGFALLHRDRAL